MSKYKYKEIDQGPRLGVLVKRKLKKTPTAKWYDYKRIKQKNKQTYEFKIYRPLTEDYYTAILSCGYEIRKNIMNDEIMIMGKRMNDAREAIVINQMNDYGFKDVHKIRRVMLEMAHDNSYHPLVDYLDGLHWDGKDRLSSLLDSFSFVSDPDWSKSVIRKWLIGSVAKISQSAQLYLLVLDGPQGCGKSYLANWLCPDSVAEFFKEGPINPGLKDTDIDSVSTWIWEVAELQATTRKADREALKSHITKQVVRVRAPYGRYSMVKNVTASYIGTINKSAGFLEDESGNRRFVIVEVDGINWHYSKLSTDQLWAQIYELYLAGETWELTAAESKYQNESNKHYDAPHPAVELFSDYYQVNDTNQEFVSSMNILLTLEDAGLNGNQRGNLMKLSEYLNSLDGVTRVRKYNKELKRQVYGYIGVEQKKWPVSKTGF